MIGQTVSHYRIIDKLGEGGMGVVYLAEDKHLARRVAIKFLTSTDHHYRARFVREARAVSALSHPNIATVHDYGETDEGQPFIVMEFIKGEMLSDLLGGQGVTLVRAVEIVAPVELREYKLIFGDVTRILANLFFREHVTFHRHIAVHIFRWGIFNIVNEDRIEVVARGYTYFNAFEINLTEAASALSRDETLTDQFSGFRIANG